MSADLVTRVLKKKKEGYCNVRLMALNYHNYLYVIFPHMVYIYLDHYWKIGPRTDVFALLNGQPPEQKTPRQT